MRSAVGISGSTLRARKGHHAGGMSSSFTLRENLKESDAIAQDIREAALETIYQFDWFGYAAQGKPCDEETERMVAELEAQNGAGRDHNGYQGLAEE